MRAVPDGKARSLARDLARAISRASARADQFDRKLDHTLAAAHALSFNSGNTRAVAECLARNRDLARAIVIGLTGAYASVVDYLDRGCVVDHGDLANILTKVLTYDLDLVHNLDRALARARAFDGDLARLTGSGDLISFIRRRARIVIHDLNGDLNHARILAHDLDGDIDHARVLARAFQVLDDPVLHVAPSAGRLVAAAARLLPVGEQDRYAEEFRSELWEIARAGGRRPTQLAYATRQVIAAWRLRAELRVPQRRGAAP